MSAHPDVLVLGGGVIGLSCAYFLAKEGAHVEVLDRGDFGQEASWAGAGILPPGNSRQAQTPYEQLRARGVEMFPDFSAELRERTDIDNGYLRCGGLELAGDAPEDADEWRNEGVACEPVEGSRLRQLEPDLAPAWRRVYFLPDMAQVRNPRHIRALVAACRSLDVGLRPECPLLGVQRESGRVLSVRTPAGELAGGQFLVAMGAWSDRFLEAVTRPPGVRPVRGQIVLLKTWMPLLHHVLCAGKRYLVPRPDGHILVGSTEEDADFDKQTTAEAVAELLGFALEVVPRLGQAPVERCWAGLRPGSPDGMPFLGPVPGYSNLYVAAGHFRSGIQLSPITGLVMRELLLGQPLTVPLEPFRMDRNPPATAAAAFRS